MTASNETIDLLTAIVDTIESSVMQINKHNS